MSKFTYFKKLMKLPFSRDIFPPESAPIGSVPVGVRPLSCKTDSDSSLIDDRKRVINIRRDFKKI